VARDFITSLFPVIVPVVYSGDIFSSAFLKIHVTPLSRKSGLPVKARGITGDAYE